MYVVKNSVTEVGIGMFSGDPIRLTLSEPYEKGIWLKNKYNHLIKLNPHDIKVSNHNTAIEFKDGSKIMLLEHLLSAIYANGITSIMIQVDADEIPLFDGSAMGYLALIKKLQLETEESVEIAYLTKKVRVEDGDYYIEASPSKKLSFESVISFPNTPIGEQSIKYTFTKKSFEEVIGMARTFGVVDDLSVAKEHYRGSSLTNTLIIEKGVLLNEERVDREFVKHKVLDAIGDLRTFECPIVMKYKSYGSSHNLNNLLLKKIIEENCFNVVKLKLKEAVSLYNGEKVKVFN